MDKKTNFSDQIKGSFEKVFQQKVPHAFWSELSTSLEEEGLLSEKETLSLEEKDLLRSSFEETHQASAPTFAWAQIADAIDKEGFFEEKLEATEESGNFGELIKASFLAEEQTAAPDIWSKIEGEIEPMASAEEKIRASFEEEHLRKAPDYIWNAVRHQINIDGVWERLVVFLDQMHYRQLWRKRLLRWTSFAALAIFMHACLPTFDYADLKQNNSSPKLEEKRPLGPLAEKVEGEDNSLDVVQIEDRNQHNSSKEKSPILKLQEGAEDLAEGDNSTEIKLNQPSRMFSSPSFEQEYKNKAAWGIPFSKVFGLSQNENSEGLVLTEGEDVRDQGDLFNKEASKEDLLTINWLASASPEFLASSQLEILPNLEPIAETKRPKNKKSYDTELGFVSAIGISMLLNEETFESWDENTLLTNNLSRFSHIGLIAIQSITQKSAIALELSGLHRIRQGYGFYSSDGYYKSKIKELSYARLAAHYQHKFFNYELFGMETNLLTRTGLFLAYLTEERSILNDVVNTTTNFEKFDLGAKVMLGQTHHWDNFVFEYGAQTDIGMLNVFNGQALGTNVNVQQTHIFSIAAYLSLRYQF